PDGPLSGCFPTNPNGVFVVKLNPAGSEVVYTARLGGGGALTDLGTAIAIDSGGNVYITGQTSSSTFTVTPAAPQLIFGGFNDAFVARISGSDTPAGSNVSVQLGV